MNIVEAVCTMFFKADQNSINEVNNAMTALKANATRLLGVIGIGIGLSSINSLIEGVDGVTDGLASAYAKFEAIEVTQNRIADAAEECRMSYAAMGNISTKLVQSGMFNAEESTKFATNFSKILKSGGKSDGEISGVMSMLNRSFQTGELNPMVLTRIISQAPQLADVVAKSFGKTKQDLKDMAKTGEITAESFKQAIINSSKEADAAFANTNIHISDALMIVGYRWAVWLYQMDESCKITKTLSMFILDMGKGAISVLDGIVKGIRAASNAVGGFRNLMMIVVPLITAFYIAFQWESIQKKLRLMNDGFKKMLGIITKIRARQIAIYAGFLLIAAVIEDIYYFINGKKISAIEESLKRAGYNVEEIRENLKGAIGELGKAFDEFKKGTGEGFKEVMKSFDGAIKSGGLKEFFAGLMSALKPAIDLLADFFRMLATNPKKAKDFGEKLGKVATAMVILSTVILPLCKVIMFLGGAFAKLAILGSKIGIVISVLSRLFMKLGGAKLLGFIINAVPGLQSVIPVLMAMKSGVLSLAGGIKVLSVMMKSGLLGGFKGLLGIMGGPMGIAIMAVIGLLYLLYTHWDDIKKGAQDAAKFIEEKFQALKDYLSNLDILGGLTKSLAKAYDFGKGLLTNMLNGVNDGKPAVKESMDELGDDIEKKFHHSVPDEGPLSHDDEWMPDMMLSFARGITENKQAVLDELSALAGDMANVEMSLNPSMASARLAQSGNSVNKIINQNVTINNEFNGDKAFQQNASNAMSGAATDITTELARGLAYAR